VSIRGRSTGVISLIAPALRPFFLVVWKLLASQEVLRTSTITSGCTDIDVLVIIYVRLHDIYLITIIYVRSRAVYILSRLLRPRIVLSPTAHNSWTLLLSFLPCVLPKTAGQARPFAAAVHLSPVVALGEESYTPSLLLQPPIR
jgi:hypothetical protein